MSQIMNYLMINAEACKNLLQAQQDEFDHYAEYKYQDADPEAEKKADELLESIAETCF